MTALEELRAESAALSDAHQDHAERMQQGRESITTSALMFLDGYRQASDLFYRQWDVIRAVQKLHRTKTGSCPECQTPAPCATYRAMEDAARKSKSQSLELRKQ